MATYNEACTMKPSGHIEFSCQTASKRRQLRELSRTASPSLTDICQGQDRLYLQSLYFTVIAIEGRIRRLNLSSKYTLDI